MEIEYVTGDATSPQGDRKKIIAHIVNNKGGWGSGFVVPLARKFPLAEQSYREWAKGDKPNNFCVETCTDFELGMTQFVIVSNDTMVANMCAQDGFYSRGNPHPCDLEAVVDCLWTTIATAYRRGADVHMPRIGCGLGGAEWDEILACIDEAEGLVQMKDWFPHPKIYVYDLPIQ